ncbi:hypothetical protein HFN62_16445 [Rhizobium leguminosarum]|uniref:hypothetical protein n=1 Tax=Rhizobium leguminosarum TaxID=384 RepID=UPI001C93B315|nr:hypothetical protein [Rhizobium leguminosarum]MBY5785307.1 hypothetical protein [Rhizobium leguminosarum]
MKPERDVKAASDERREIETVLAYHDADARAAIGTLLDDIRHLRRQLALAEGAMSRGMTRGWLPDYDRR